MANNTDVNVFIEDPPYSTGTVGYSSSVVIIPRYHSERERKKEERERERERERESNTAFFYVLYGTAYSITDDR